MKDKSINDHKNNTENLEEQKPEILEEIEVEDLTVDGICGVY